MSLPPVSRASLLIINPQPDPRRWQPPRPRGGGSEGYLEGRGGLDAPRRAGRGDEGLVDGDGAGSFTRPGWPPWPGGRVALCEPPVRANVFVAVGGPGDPTSVAPRRAVRPLCCQLAFLHLQTRHSSTWEREARGASRAAAVRRLLRLRQPRRRRLGAPPVQGQRLKAPSPSGS